MPDLQPYAETIGLLIVGVFQALHHRKLKKIETNDLHELPQLVPALTDIASTLQRIEVKLGSEFSYIRARLNGKE